MVVIDQGCQIILTLRSKNYFIIIFSERAIKLCKIFYWNICIIYACIILYWVQSNNLFFLKDVNDSYRKSTNIKHCPL